MLPEDDSSFEMNFTEDKALAMNASKKKEKK